eukprot:1189564-Prorocentrum_minimum.AAC.3
MPANSRVAPQLPGQSNWHSTDAIVRRPACFYYGRHERVAERVDSHEFCSTSPDGLTRGHPSGSYGCSIRHDACVCDPKAVCRRC